MPGNTEEREQLMKVSVEVRQGAVTRQVSVTTYSIERALQLAAAEVIDELTFFGFSGTLKLSRKEGGPMVFQADLGSLAAAREPVKPAAG